MREVTDRFSSWLVTTLQWSTDSVYHRALDGLFNWDQDAFFPNLIRYGRCWNVDIRSANKE